MPLRTPLHHRSERQRLACVSAGQAKFSSRRDVKIGRMADGVGAVLCPTSTAARVGEWESGTGLIDSTIS